MQSTENIMLRLELGTSEVHCGSRDEWTVECRARSAQAHYTREKLSLHRSISSSEAAREHLIAK